MSLSACSRGETPDESSGGGGGRVTAEETEEPAYEVIRKLYASGGYSLALASDGYLWALDWAPEVPGGEEWRSVIRIAPEPGAEAKRVYPWSDGGIGGKLFAYKDHVYLTTKDYMTQVGAIVEFALDGTVEREFTLPETPVIIDKVYADDEVIVGIGDSCRAVVILPQDGSEPHYLDTGVTRKGGALSVALTEDAIYCVAGEYRFKFDKTTGEVLAQATETDDYLDYGDLLLADGKLLIVERNSLGSYTYHLLRMDPESLDVELYTELKGGRPAPVYEPASARLYLQHWGEGISSIPAAGGPQRAETPPGKLKSSGVRFALDARYFYALTEDKELVRIPRTAEGYGELP
jgi:hypothetical protein